MDADVAVVGLGSMGSMALWQVASRGVGVVGFEQFELGHTKGAAHGESKVFRSAYAEGPEYVPLLKDVLGLWRGLEEETGRPLLTMTGGVMIGERDGSYLSGILRSAHEYDLQYRQMTSDEAMQSFPQLRLRDQEHAIWEPRAGVLRPELATAAATKRAQQLGARVVPDSRVDSVKQSGHRVEIRHDGQTTTVGHAIIASGGWTSKILGLADSPFWVERQVQAWFPLESPDLYAPERFSVFGWHAGDVDWYGFPTLDGRTIKVAFHHGGERTDPDGMDREVHPSDIDPLAERVAQGLNGVRPEPLKSITCMYMNTPDDHFVIGALPDAPRIVLAGPMGGHGYKFAPIVGRATAQIAIDGSSEYDVAHFDPGRIPELMGAGR